MDIWFTIEPMLEKLLETGMDAIRMTKQLKQRYNYQGKAYTLPELQKFVHIENSKNILGSVIVITKKELPVKIVIVRNRNKKDEYLYLLSDTKIVRIYGNL